MRRGALAAAALPLLLSVISGCAPSRTMLAGAEGDRAAGFFAGMGRDVTYPLKASFSGVALPFSKDAVPFVAGVNAAGPDEETFGVYDPLGRGVAFLANDGRRIEISRGPAADLAGFRGAPPVAAGPLSVARVLSGVPGFPVEGGETAREGDGGWSIADGRQALYSDPGRRFLARAEYRLPGMTVSVSYPGRESPGPPDRLEMAFRWAKITMRRDPE